MSAEQFLSASSRPRIRVDPRDLAPPVRLLDGYWGAYVVLRSGRAVALRPADNLEVPVVGLGNGCAAFNPIAAVDVDDAQPLMDCGVVNVPADDPVNPVLPSSCSEDVFVPADHLDGIFHLELRRL